MERKAYPSDISDEEWAFVAPYLTLMNEEAPQRIHSLREIFNGLRWEPDVTSKNNASYQVRLEKMGLECGDKK